MNATKAENGFNWQRMVLKLYPFFVLGLLLIFFGVLTKGTLFSSRNIKNILESSFQYLIGCMAALFIFAQGEQDFSMASNIALSAILAAMISKTSVPLALVVALVSGIAVGCACGFLYARLPIPVFFLTMCIANVIAGFLGPMTNYQSVKTPVSMLNLDNTNLKLLVAVIFAVIIYVIYNKTTYGKYSRAIGASPVVARLSGINLSRYKFAAFVFTGIAAGIVAFFSICKSGGASKATGTMFHFNVMVAMALGGATTGGPKVKFRCAVIGPLIISVLTLGMNLARIPVGMQNLMKGVLFLAVMVLSDRLSRFDVD
ncbi:MAG: ABC transporter permease [Lachnospiraceae bacterium]|nr:ABC transporter permease [Lachnospiraceae bacterium]